MEHIVTHCNTYSSLIVFYLVTNEDSNLPLHGIWAWGYIDRGGVGSFTFCSVSNRESGQGGADMVEGKDKKRRKPMVKIPPKLSVVEGGSVVALTRGQGRNAFGLTAKMEEFCQGLAMRGETQAGAYRAAYDTSNMTPPNVQNEAYKLMQRPDIIARVNMLCAEKAARAQHDSGRIRSHVIESLHRESQDPNNPPSVRVRALELLGKLDVVGAFRERSVVEAEHAPASDLAQTLQARLQALLGKAS